MDTKAENTLLTHQNEVLEVEVEELRRWKAEHDTPDAASLMKKLGNAEVAFQMEKDKHKQTKDLLEVIKFRGRTNDKNEQDQVDNAVQIAVVLNVTEIDDLKDKMDLIKKLHIHANFELELANKNLNSAAREKKTLLEVIRQLKEVNSKKQEVAFQDGRQSMRDDAQVAMLKAMQNLK